MAETEMSASQDRDVDNFSWDRDETLLHLQTETTTLWPIIDYAEELIWCSLKLQKEYASELANLTAVLKHILSAWFKVLIKWYIYKPRISHTGGSGGIV